MFKIDTGGVFKFLETAVDQIFDTPEEKAAAKAKIMKAASDGRINELNASLSVMLAEAKSADKWTSRARPGFLYVVYAYILAAIPFGVLFAFEPGIADDVAGGVKMWLASIPDQMWTLFGAGYLGYVGARSYDKARSPKS